jgi:hypothetical protein
VHQPDRRAGRQLHEYLTPLNDVQKRILVLMEVPLESYNGLVTGFSKTAFHSPET